MVVSCETTNRIKKLNWQMIKNALRLHSAELYKFMGCRKGEPLAVQIWYVCPKLPRVLLGLNATVIYWSQPPCTEDVMRAIREVERGRHGAA